MAEFPALQLWTDAFIADTTHLNATQTGAYIMLLMCAWRSKDCALPDDDKILARFARMDLRQWRANKSVIMEFWTLNKEQKWVQARLLDERKIANDKRDQAARAGKASALKRKERHATSVDDPLQQNGNHPQPRPHNHINPPTPLFGLNSCEEFFIENYLDEKAYEKAKENAPGWDMQYLIQHYNMRIHKAESPVPHKPSGAFIAWCKAFTKGKPPK